MIKGVLSIRECVLAMLMPTILLGRHLSTLGVASLESEGAEDS